MDCWRREPTFDTVCDQIKEEWADGMGRETNDVEPFSVKPDLQYVVANYLLAYAL